MHKYKTVIRKLLAFRFPRRDMVTPDLSLLTVYRCAVQCIKQAVYLSLHPLVTWLNIQSMGQRLSRPLYTFKSVEQGLEPGSCPMCRFWVLMAYRICSLGLLSLVILTYLGCNCTKIPWNWASTCLSWQLNLSSVGHSTNNSNHDLQLYSLLRE